MSSATKAKRGYSRDGRPDCLQLVIAAIITTDGFPLAYEVFDGRTSDRTTLRGFLEKIENSYGKAKRTYVMDRGIPTEEVLQEMREPGRETFYLVGTPKSKIQEYEKKWLDLPWQKVRGVGGGKTEDPATLWTRYVQLTQIEAVFRSLKSELGIRPIHHQLEHRADAHILVAFLAQAI